MTERPPEKPEAKVITKNNRPMCGACNRQIQTEDQWRCPYQTCPLWFRSL